MALVYAGTRGAATDPPRARNSCLSRVHRWICFHIAAVWGVPYSLAVAKNSRREKRKRKEEKTGPHGATRHLREDLPLKFLWIVLAFLVLTLILYARVLSPQWMIAATDQLTAGVFFREFQARVLRHLHTFPLWNPYIFAGLPFIDALHGDMFYLTALFRLVFPTHVVMNYTFILHTFLAGITAFLLFRSLLTQRVLALLLALAYMYSASLVSLAYPGHDGKAVAIAFFPLLFYLTYQGLRTGARRYFFGNALLLGYLTLSIHIQMMYYTYLVLGLLWLFEAVGAYREQGTARAVRISLYFWAMVILAVGVAALKYVPAFEYLSQYSPRSGAGRGYEFATSWALPWEDFLSTFLPRFSGFLDHYWGSNPFKINSEYAGFLAWLPALYALAFARRTRFFAFLITLFGVFFFIVLGGHTPVFQLFYHLLPQFKKFRAHSMAFFVLNLDLLLLGALAFQGLMDQRDRPETWRRFWLLTGAWVAVYLITAGLYAPLARFFVHDPRKVQLIAVNAPVYQRFALMTALLAGGFAWILAAYLRRRLDALPFVALASLLVLADLWPHDLPFIQRVPAPDRYYAPDAVVQTLQRDPGVYRVFPLFYKVDNNYLMWYDIESIGGHHGNQFRRYQELVGAENTIMFRPQSVMDLYRYPQLVDLLDVRYVVTQPLPEDLRPYDPPTRAWLQMILDFLHRPGMQEVYRDRQVVIYRNAHQLGRLFAVDRYEVLSPDQVLRRMKSEAFDPRRVAFLEQDPGVVLPTDTLPLQFSYRFVERTPNRIRAEITLSRPALVIYSGNFYPQFQARLDGRPVPVYVADYILRGVFVEAGTHTLEFVYHHDFWRRGGGISLVSLLLILAFLAWPVRSKKKP